MEKRYFKELYKKVKSSKTWCSTWVGDASKYYVFSPNTLMIFKGDWDIKNQKTPEFTRIFIGVDFGIWKTQDDLFAKVR